MPLPGSTSRHAAFAPAALRSAACDELLRALAVGAVEQPLGLRRRVAEVEQAVAGQGARILGPADRDLGAVGVALDLARDLLAQLDDDPLGGALADSRHRLEALGVAGGDRPQQLARRPARERRDRDLGPDAADRDQLRKRSRSSSSAKP